MTLDAWEVVSYAIAIALSGGLVGYLLGRLRAEEWKAWAKKGQRVVTEKAKGAA